MSMQAIHAEVLMLTLLRRLSSHRGFWRYLENTSWPVLEKAMRILLGISVGVWVARYLGPLDFGMFSYVESFIGIFMVFVHLGLDSIVLRETVKEEVHRDNLLGSAFVLKISGAISGMLLIGLFVYAGDIVHPLRGLIFLASLSLLFEACDVANAYFQGKVLFKYSAFSNITALVLVSSIKIVLILAGSPLIYFVATMALDSLLAVSLLLYYYARRASSPLRWRFRGERAISLLKDSWPLFLSSVATSIYTKMDQIMLRGFLDDHAVGIYAAATKVSSSCGFVSYIITTSLLPAVVASKMRGEKEYRFRLQKLYDFMLLLFIVISIIIIFMSDFIIDTLYGEAFALSTPILAVHIVCTLFTSAFSVQNGWFVTEGLQRYALLFQIVCALSNMAFNALLINSYGIIGAAYGTLLAYGFTLVFAGVFIAPMRPSFMMILKSYGHILTLRFLRKDYYGPTS